MFSCTVSRLSLPVAAATAAISRGGWGTQFLAGVAGNKHRLMIDFQAYLGIQENYVILYNYDV